MNKKYTLTTNIRPAMPRSKRLRDVGTVATTAATVSVTDSGDSAFRTIFDRMFELVNTGTDEAPAWTIKAKYDFWSVGNVVAYGMGVTESGGGAGAPVSMATLTDVALTQLQSGNILQYNGSHWVNVPVSSIKADLTGYATEQWVTDKGYATESWVTGKGYATEQWVTGKGYALASALSAYLPAASYTAADVLAKLKTVDGTGSGLDADTVDGQHAYAFVDRKEYSGADNLTILQANYAALADSRMHAIKLVHGSHSMGIGWFLTSYPIEKAYGGWFISDYAVPSWVGVSAGVWTTKTFAFKENTVAKAGDTMTGALTVPKLIVGGGALTWDADAQMFKLSHGVYSEGNVVAYGKDGSAGGSASGGGVSYGLMRAWPTSAPSATTNDALGANLGYELHTRLQNVYGKSTIDTMLAGYQPKGNYVTVDTEQEITAHKIFNGSNTVAYGAWNVGQTIRHAWHTGLEIASDDSVVGMGVHGINKKWYWWWGEKYPSNTTGSNAHYIMEFNGALFDFKHNVRATQIIKNGGTSSQFLKADGSVDSNTYALASALGSYLPVSAYTAADVLAKLKTVDGAGSGLDADTVDGVHNGNLTAKYFESSNPGPGVWDCNEPTTTLLFDYGSAGRVISNAPTNYGYGCLFTIGRGVLGNSLSAQFIWDVQHGTQYPGVLWFRTKDSITGWRGWGRLAFTSDNVESATKLATPRTIWGQNFNGEGNVSGNMSGVGNITPIASHGYNLGSAALVWEHIYCRYIDTDAGYNLRMRVGGAEKLSIDAATGYVGINNAAPAYQLDVQGVIRASGDIRMQHSVFSDYTECLCLFNNAGAIRKMAVGSLYVGNDYASADTVPELGIYTEGDIKIGPTLFYNWDDNWLRICKTYGDSFEKGLFVGGIVVADDDSYVEDYNAGAVPNYSIVAMGDIISESTVSGFDISAHNRIYVGDSSAYIEFDRTKKCFVFSHAIVSKDNITAYQK